VEIGAWGGATRGPVLFTIVAGTFLSEGSRAAIRVPPPNNEAPLSWIAFCATHVYDNKSVEEYSEV